MRELSCQVEAYSLTKRFLISAKKEMMALILGSHATTVLSVFTKAMQFGDVTFVYMPYP